MKSFILSLLCLSCLFSCKKNNSIAVNQANEYAAYFSVLSNGNTTEITSAGKTISLPHNFRVKKCIVTTTSPSAYIDALGHLHAIVGVCSPDYFYNPNIAEGITKQTIANVGNDGTLNFEKIIALKPDLIITAPNPNYEKTLQQLIKIGINVIYIEEYKELHPLGKTEYLKLFGTLFGETQKADSIYQNVKNNYLALQKKTKNLSHKPTVFTNIMYGGDAWYMPGGKSFIATLLNDAGADYLWKYNQGTGTTPLSFEEVFSKAKNADYWIGASNFNSKQEMLSAYTHYEWFSAYQNNRIYTMNGKENKQRANDYYESGSIYADKSLADVIKVLHPELLPEYSLTYLKKLE